MKALRKHLVDSHPEFSKAKKINYDGYQVVLQVNYISQVLLLELLMPLLRKSGEPARVMVTSSALHQNACESMNFNRTDCFADGGPGLERVKANLTNLSVRIY